MRKIRKGPWIIVFLLTSFMNKIPEGACFKPLPLPYPLLNIYDIPRECSSISLSPTIFPLSSIFFSLSLPLSLQSFSLYLPLSFYVSSKLWPFRKFFFVNRFCFDLNWKVERSDLLLNWNPSLLPGNAKRSHMGRGLTLRNRNWKLRQGVLVDFGKFWIRGPFE